MVNQVHLAPEALGTHSYYYKTWDLLFRWPDPMDGEDHRPGNGYYGQRYELLWYGQMPVILHGKNDKKRLLGRCELDIDLLFPQQAKISFNRWATCKIVECSKIR